MFDEIKIIHPSLVYVESINLNTNKFELSQNYPNPFNPTTVIKYSIKGDTNVSLKIFNTLGQEITSPINKKQKPGNYKVTFDATDLSGGVYFYILKTEDFVSTKKMLLMK